MKRIFVLFVIPIIACGITSCKKESSDPPGETYIRQFSSDTDFASMGIIRLDDGNYLLAGFEYRSESPIRRNAPRLIKIDSNGDVIWDKRPAQSGTTLYKLLPVAGKGFVTLGVADFSSFALVLCLYNNDGELVSEHQVIFNEEIYEMSPFDMIQLSNGNYAIAGNNRWTGTGLLKILNSAFDSLYYREFTPPDSNYYNVNFRKMCETPDGNLALVASTVTYPPIYEQHNAIIRTDLTGILGSFVILESNGLNETPYAVAFNNNKLIVPSVAYSTDWESGFGCEVNYDLHYGVNGLGSGRINIQSYGENNELLTRAVILGYPRNGSIHSMHKTSDGGFILCGTVDQGDSYYLLSDTKMYLLKLDTDLNMQWSKTIGTVYQSLGIEAV